MVLILCARFVSPTGTLCQDCQPYIYLLLWSCGGLVDMSLDCRSHGLQLKSRLFMNFLCQDINLIFNTHDPDSLKCNSSLTAAMLKPG